jgi:hypothetical protein
LRQHLQHCSPCKPFQTCLALFDLQNKHKIIYFNFELLICVSVAIKKIAALA